MPLLSRVNRLWPFLLLGPLAFGQHITGLGRGGSPGFARSLSASPAASIRVRGDRTRTELRRDRPRHRLDRGYNTPYGSFLGSGIYAYDGSQYDEESDGERYPEGSRDGTAQLVQQARPETRATAVIREYNFERQPAQASVPPSVFTIVLKDGSKQSTVATWVQSGKLYYIDASSRQQVLLPGLIDRQATERANQQNSIRMELPPGA